MTERAPIKKERVDIITRCVDCLVGMAMAGSHTTKVADSVNGMHEQILAPLDDIEVSS